MAGDTVRVAAATHRPPHGVSFGSVPVTKGARHAGLRHLPLAGRDLRLDLFRGLANWAIFLDHIPHEVLSWATTRNYGFSDAADLFVFISGYTAAFVFGRVMIERGFLAAASRR